MAHKISIKKVSDNIDHEQPLYVKIHNVTVIADKVDAQGFETYDDNGIGFDVKPAHYIISSHDGMMPAFHTSEYATIEDLAAAMKQLADLRTWKMVRYDE